MQGSLACFAIVTAADVAASGAVRGWRRRRLMGERGDTAEKVEDDTEAMRLRFWRQHGLYVLANVVTSPLRIILYATSTIRLVRGAE